MASLIMSARSVLPAKKRKTSVGSINSLDETTDSSSLPAKKRANSIGSNESQEGEETAAASSSVPAGESTSSSSATITEEVMITKDPPAATATIRESRLPSKKRKGSHDSSVKFQDDVVRGPRRKGSHDLTVQFRDDVVRPPRKGSQDLSSAPSDDNNNNNNNAASRLLGKGTQADSLSGGSLDDNSCTFPPREDSNDASASIKIDELIALAPEPVAVLKPLPSLLPHVTPNQSGSGGDGTAKTPVAGETSVLYNLEALAPTPVISNAKNIGAPATEKTRKNSDADVSGSTVSTGQRMLFEAMMMNSNSHQSQSGATATAAANAASASLAAGRGRDRLESWGGMSDLSFPKDADQLQQQPTPAEVESANVGNKNSAIPSAASSVTNPVQHSTQQQQQPESSATIPSRIQLDRERLNSLSSSELGRDRLNSLASFSEFGLGRDRLNSLASLSEISPTIEGADSTSTDIQAFVAVAMASVGDQLAELAAQVETAASAVDGAAAAPAAAPGIEELNMNLGLESDCSVGTGASQPMIGVAVSDATAKRTARRKNTARGRSGSDSSGSIAVGRPRSLSVSSGKISVDYDAVAAAVDAAEAATGALDLAVISDMGPPTGVVSSSMVTGRSVSSKEKPRHSRRQLPLSRSARKTPAKGKNGVLERSSAANTNVAPTSSKKKHLPPIKKRVKRNSPEADKIQSSSRTPKASNRASDALHTSCTDIRPESAKSSMSASNSAVKGQANQKWESMYESLLEFEQMRRKEETKDLSEKEKSFWVWDGNVPTTYKTKNNKALGRWVNNQRSAKSKGTLRLDREQRLIDAGLKWTVLSSNSWNEMLKELSVYIEDQAKQGKAWDGNVPTNYQIKSRPNGQFAGEDKNLGRWVNRQRSLFQAGRLRKDRQIALENIGLKWSMLATTSWDSMFNTLMEYVNERKKESGDGKGNGSWDGNVPANYRTNDNPPRALGRWINRQRSAYTKNKLKKECKDKLNAIGLKWSVHERAKARPTCCTGDNSQDNATDKAVALEEANEVAKEDVEESTAA